MNRSAVALKRVDGQRVQYGEQHLAPVDVGVVDGGRWLDRQVDVGVGFGRFLRRRHECRLVALVLVGNDNMCAHEAAQHGGSENGDGSGYARLPGQNKLLRDVHSSKLYHLCINLSMNAT